MGFVNVKQAGGRDVIKVSKRYFETVLARHGYVLVEEQKAKKNNEYESVKEQPVEENIPEVETIPLSEMNQEQVKEYAQIHNIDLSTAKSLKQAKAIIRKEMQEDRA